MGQSRSSGGAAGGQGPRPGGQGPRPGSQGPRPGARNLITDVDGVLVGNAHDVTARTGVTVLKLDPAGVAAVDIRGGGPGTRETDLLAPENLVHEVNAIVLSGGSVYGLEAAGGVAAWLGARGQGYRLVGAELVAPIVPSAILFDLTNGGDKKWGEDPPYRALGKAAVEAAGKSVRLGNVGAGFGARAGAYKGGLGSASVIAGDGATIGALIAVNAFGSPVMPGTTTLWAGLHAIGEEMGPDPLAGLPREPLPQGLPADTKLGGAVAGANTTIGVVATDVALTSGQAKRLAVMAQDGLARALRPVHTPVDGDVLFVVATGKRPLGEPEALKLLALGTLAADCVARAIGRGVWEAETLGPSRSLREVRAQQRADAPPPGVTRPPGDTRPPEGEPGA